MEGSRARGRRGARGRSRVLGGGRRERYERGQGAGRGAGTRGERGLGGGARGSGHPLGGVPALTGAEDVPVRHQLRQRPRTVLLHPAGRRAQRRGPNRLLPSPLPVPPPAPHHGRFLPHGPAMAPRAASRERRERGNGAEGAGPGRKGGGAWETGAGSAGTGWSAAGGGRAKVRAGGARRGAGPRSVWGAPKQSVVPRVVPHRSAFALLRPRSVSSVPAYSGVAQRWPRPLPPPAGAGGALSSQPCRKSSRAELSNYKLHLI